MADSFFDTNILLYLASTDETKARKAEALIADGGTISVQVLNEIANVARRKMRLEWHGVHLLLDTVRALLDVVPLTLEVHDLGLDIADRYQLSTYDAMIAAAALESRCKTLWSEDMQDGMLIHYGLRIRNPFNLD